MHFGESIEHQRQAADQQLREMVGATVCCKWHEDDDGNWDTDCDGKFMVLDGTPAENEMKFCCYCGKPLYERRQLTEGE